MKSHTQTKGTEHYVAPESKTIIVQIDRICNVSNFGTPGQAGPSGAFGEEETGF